MRTRDLILLAWSNLRRNRLRSVMTLSGVTIGVAALAILLAYGAGLQCTARSEFQALQLQDVLRITSHPGLTDRAGDIAFLPQDSTGDGALTGTVPLTDSLLAVFAGIDGVRAAYPEVVFPVRLKAHGRAVVSSAEAVPRAFAALPSYQPTDGAFFSSPVDSALLMTPSMARRLGFDPPKSILNQPIALFSATLDTRRMRRRYQNFAFGMVTPPVAFKKYTLRVVGLLPEKDQQISGLFRVLIPLDLAKSLRKITFFSTLDLLLGGTQSEGYTAARVLLSGPGSYEPVRRALLAHGVYVSGFRDQFARLERLFLVLDLALAIIGFIALLVATLGIANTMLMSVLERTQELGLMKAVGGDEGDLQRLFLVESAMLGLAGGGIGLMAAWGLSHGMNGVLAAYLHRMGLPGLELFHLTPLMALGILGVALGVSLLAGALPARRAARIEPIRALRTG